MGSCLKNRKWEGPHSTTYKYLFSQRKLFFWDGSTPHSSNSVANAPEKPSALAGTCLLPLYHWLAPSSWQHCSFPSFPWLWSSTSWEKPWDAERQEPSTFPGIPPLFSDKRNQRLDSVWKEMRNRVWVTENMIRWKIIPTITGKVGRISLAGINTGEHVRWLGWSLLVVKA